MRLFSGILLPCKYRLRFLPFVFKHCLAEYEAFSIMDNSNNNNTTTANMEAGTFPFTQLAFDFF